MAKFSELTPVRAIDPAIIHCIPRPLFESIPDLEPDMIDRIYRHAADIMTIPVVNEKNVIVSRRPSHNVWVTVWFNETHLVKAFLWAEFDPIMRCAFIQACAVDKEYQSSRSEVFKSMIDYVLSLPIAPDIKNKIFLATSRPAGFEKVGLVKSKRILMEFHNEPAEQDNKDTEGEANVSSVPEPVISN